MRLLGFLILAVIALHAGVASAGEAVGAHAVSSTSVALVDGSGGVVVREDDGRVRKAKRPAGCTLNGAGAGRLLWDCGPAVAARTERLVVARPDGRSSRTVTIQAPADGGDAAALVSYPALGARWLAAHVSGYHYDTTRYLDWRTGRWREGREDQDPAKAVDLDRADLFAPLCSGIRREASPQYASQVSDPLLPLVSAGPWTAASTPTGGTRLSTCDGGAPIAIAGARDWDLTSLAAGWFAWSDPLRAPATLRLVHLADRQRTSIRTGLVQILDIAMTRRAVYVTGRAWALSARTSVRRYAFPRAWS